MATEKRRRNKVSVGLAAELPTITNPGVSFGDEFYATDTGAYSKVTPDSTGAKQWTTSALGSGIQAGTDVLVTGTKVITATVTVKSRIIVSRRDLPGGGTSIGAELSVPNQGVAGANFTVNSVAEVNQAVVAADTSKFDWMVIG